MKLSSSKPQRIKLYGTHGSFKTGVHEFRLNYLMTIANGRGGSAHSDLLESLKPMRERVRLDNISSLEEILQRDVDDARVASGIVEYLIGDAGRQEVPSFFPSVVVVLMPQEIFQDSSCYPSGTSLEGGTEYGGSWSYRPITDEDGVASVIGELEVDLKRVWPVVIDGQHRTMGFRFVSRSNSTSIDTDIYDKFYQVQESKRPDFLDADLPVTLIWFDNNGGGDVDVLEFCRQLFLDINQSSQQIAESRKILLSELDPMSLVTRGFYDWLVQSHGASKNGGLSLIHSGFDFPEDLGKRLDWSPLSVFVPELLRFALMQMLLLKPQENRSGLRSGKLVGLKAEKLMDESMFNFVFGDEKWEELTDRRVDIEERESFVMKTREAREELICFADSDLYPRLYEVLDAYGPIRAVVGACTEMDNDKLSGAGFFDPAGGGMKTPRLETWNKVFCGGTGLYYSIRNSNQENLAVMRAELKACAAELYKHAAIKAQLTFEDWTLLRQKTLTKAGFIGLFMAYRSVVSKSLTYQAGHKVFTSALEGVDWINSFQPFVLALAKETTYLKDLDPKAWTIFRDVILLFLKNEDGVCIEESCSSDFERNLFLHELDLIVKAHSSSNGVAVNDMRNGIVAGNWSEDLSKDLFESWVESVRNKVNGVLVAGGLISTNENWLYNYSDLNK